MYYLSPFEELTTLSYHGYNLQFSPFNGCIAIAAAENFGIQGCGALIIYDFSKLKAQALNISKYCAGIYDVAWSEDNPDLILTGSSDGFIQSWSLHSLKEPIKNQQSHTGEISSVNWCPLRNNVYCSSSWDSLVKLWNVYSDTPVAVLSNHRLLVYESTWSKPSPNQLASVSGDGTFIWDPLRNPAEPVISFPSVMGTEVLTCDWSSVYGYIMAVASTDGFVSVWDLRSITKPLLQIKRHTGAIRKLRFSPILPYEFVTVSYDFSTKLWDASCSNPLVYSVERHSEFVYGIDYDRANPKRIADCGWDRKVTIYYIQDIKENSPSHADNLSVATSVRVNPQNQNVTYTRNPTALDGLNFISRPLPPIPNHIDLGSKM